MNKWFLTSMELSNRHQKLIRLSSVNGLLSRQLLCSHQSLLSAFGWHTGILFRHFRLGSERDFYGAKYLFLFPPLVSSKWVKNVCNRFAQFVYFVREVCLLLNFLNDKIHNYEVNTLPSKTNWAKLINFSLVLREREE